MLAHEDAGCCALAHVAHLGVQAVVNTQYALRQGLLACRLRAGLTCLVSIHSPQGLETCGQPFTAVEHSKMHP